MKQLLLFAAMLFSISAMAQQPVITFNETTHDFGKINEADGRVTTIFEFTNEGMIPLVLSNVRASCGCTTPKWTREPIEPGATGQITVTYNPNGRPGRFQKTVTVTSNATEPTVRLYIKGEVIPKPTNPAEKYPVKMGALNLKQKSWNYGILYKKEGNTKSCSIEYTNLSSEPITVDIIPEIDADYLRATATLPEIKPGETGQIKILLDVMQCPTWGPITPKVYVVVNGQRQLTNEFAITMKADIKEDFTGMTTEQIQQAPILDIANTINLGTIKAGKKFTTKFTLSNAGINPLSVRRIVNDDKVQVVAPKATIKGGKKYDATMTINAVGLEPGNYTRTITVITNDPKRSVARITINWVIQ